MGFGWMLESTVVGCLKKHPGCREHVCMSAKCTSRTGSLDIYDRCSILEMDFKPASSHQGQCSAVVHSVHCVVHFEYVTGTIHVSQLTGVAHTRMHLVQGDMTT